MKTKFKFAILCSAIIGMLAACDKGNITIIFPSSSGSVTITPSTSTSKSTNTDHNGYYSSVDNNKTGNDLLAELRRLNNTKRKKMVGYKNLGDYYLQTDGDPDNPGNVICFYSGKSVKFSGSFSGNVNREHVWPKSRGGSVVEGDLHMTRPTLTNENGSRGNAFFVENSKSQSNGWDPAMESFGQEYYRGITARIVFYCVIGAKDSSLSLVDTNNDNQNNKTMGKLSTLLDWNYRYDIHETEIRRNDAIEKIQGNRNPFIDDRSYACSVFKNYNSSTQQICSKYGY